MADCKTTFPGTPSASLVEDTLTSPKLRHFPRLDLDAESSLAALARIVHQA
jgi:hypothetical protein